MKRPGIFAFAVCVILAGMSSPPAASAVEIPEGLETNIEMGDFHENEYVSLEKLIVMPWWNSDEEGERAFVGVALDYNEPDYEDEPPEKISIAFGVWDSGKKALITGAMGGSVKSSGPFAFKWDMRDKNGDKVPDGIYRVVMNITGEHYGDLLRNGGFPLYVTSGAPTLEDGGISSRQGVLEFDGAPEVRFATTNVNAVVAVEYDEEENELSRWERVLGPGAHKLKSDLRDSESNPFSPGKYATRITVSNPFGEDREFVARYTMRKAEPLEVSVKMNAGAEMTVDEKTTLPFTVTVNQNARVVLQHLSDGGARHYIGKSSEEKPEFLLAKGTHDGQWNRRPNKDSTSHYNKGTHWIRVTATSLAGEKMVVDTHKVTLKAKPQEVKTPPNLTLSLSPDHVVIGGRMQTRIEYSIAADAQVRLALYDSGSGELLKDLVYKQMKRGRYAMNLGVDSLDEGNYRIVLRAQNRHGHRETAKILSVGWRRR